MIKIAPSLLSADYSALGEAVRMAEEGGADLIHFDVMDGHFVPNITIGPLVVEAVRKHSSIPFDVHLMIHHPERYIEDFAKAGADIITVHVEASVHLHRTISQIKASGVKAGVALNPATPLEFLDYVLDEVDLVLLMSVNPGFGGQEFIPSSLERIRRARAMIPHSISGIELEVDGGINRETAPAVASAGATILVAGSSVYRSGNVAQAIASLREACTKSFCNGI